MKITFDITTRLNLAVALGQQRGRPRDTRVLYDILEKIEVPDGERGNYVKELPNGRTFMNEEAIAAAPAIDVDLDKEEIRRLKELFDWEGFTTGDHKWIRPLQKQVEDVTKI